MIDDIYDIVPGTEIVLRKRTWNQIKIKNQLSMYIPAGAGVLSM